MIALTVAELAAVVGAVVPAGPLAPAGPEAGAETGAELTGLVVDSRQARPGSLFVALAGERVDGHDYVARVLADGAVAALTARAVPGAEERCLVVPDPLHALGLVARHLVDRAVAGGLQVVALTGSQGKTSTKDLLGQVLELAAPTVAPHGNLNNEIGVPLTVARLEPATRYLVVEMGARGVGHIAYLCGLTPPRVGLVLNVGQAHVGQFGSRQAIARAKGELVEALPADGTAVLNADDPLVWAMRDRTAAGVVACAVSGEPDHPRAVWAGDVRPDALSRCRFVLHARGFGAAGADSQVEVELRVTGRHQVANALAAAGVALSLGLDLELVGRGLGAAVSRSGSRMELHERGDAVLVVNDAYNANPESAEAALETLAEVGRARRTRWAGATTWAVLGDMLELGPAAVSAHEALGRRLAELGVDRLVAVGEHAPDLARGAREGGLDPAAVDVLVTKEGAAAVVLGHLRPGDAVLVKASRGLALDTVAEEIWTAAPSVPSVPPGRHSEDPA